MTDHASTAVIEPVLDASDPFAEMTTASAETEAAESGMSDDGGSDASTEVPHEDVELLESATADLRLGFLVWTTRLALVAMIIVGVVGLLLGALALSQKPDAAMAAALQQRCLLDVVLCAGFGMIAAAARAGAIDRRRRIARTIAAAAAERARRDAARAREAVRKAAAEREAAETEAREAKLAARAAEEARETALESERAAVLSAVEESVRLEMERQAETAQRERERKATEERIERAIRDGTRAA